MLKEVELYDGYYGNLTADPQSAVRRATYDEDVGQASWITMAEAREFFTALKLGPSTTALEVACGSGGMTCRLASETGAHCIGIDINAQGIDAAIARAAQLELTSQVSFQLVDAARQLPFADESFDAIFCNDSINHLRARLDVFRDWFRVLRPGGRILFTDPIVVSGQLTNEEIRARSSIGYFLFTPLGLNERMLDASGFEVRAVQDRTEAVASISRKWSDARSERRGALVRLESESNFEGVQWFLESVHTLATERRLSRFMYLAIKP